MRKQFGFLVYLPLFCLSLNLGVQGWTGDWDCVTAVDRLPALHYSVDFIFLSFGIIGFIVEL